MSLHDKKFINLLTKKKFFDSISSRRKIFYFILMLKNIIKKYLYDKISKNTYFVFSDLQNNNF